MYPHKPVGWTWKKVCRRLNVVTRPNRQKYLVQISKDSKARLELPPAASSHLYLAYSRADEAQHPIHPIRSLQMA
jgi:hypothetical protein